MRALLLLALAACAAASKPRPVDAPAPDASMDEICCTAFVPPLSCYPPPGQCRTYSCGTVCTQASEAP